MGDYVKSQKYNEGFSDGCDGFPANRFMREDLEYMNGYNEAIKLSDAERAKEGEG